MLLAILPIFPLAVAARFRPGNLDWQPPRSPRASLLQPQVHRRQASGGSPFLNSNTTGFLVNGTGIPDVDFDVGESYAGQLPVGGDSDGNIFFWFFPTTQAVPEDKIIIWLNGGPGCSSLGGVLRENGPFVWQPGTFKPFANPWSWHHLSHVVYVEQPIGTGFSTGTVTVKNEDDVAQQFMGFWKNFVDAFGIQGYEVLATGESYAGAYCPYIASNMLDANDTAYFNVTGMLLYDPAISGGSASITPTNYFLQYWRNVLPLNHTTVEYIQNVSEACGYNAYVDEYLRFPPSGQQPDQCQTPGVNDDCTYLSDECDVSSYALNAIFEMNPGFSIYQVTQLLPVPDDVLGFPYSAYYLSPGREIYFNRADVKTAIHAPLDVDWMVCADHYVFDGSDNSDPSSYKVLPDVIERTNNVQIAHGSQDMILLSNGTLLAIQNMTWNGQMGFQYAPRSDLIVPPHDNPDVAGASGQGVLGTWHEERGLTWVLVQMTGHMVPISQAAVSYRQIQKLLGQITSLSDSTPFPAYNDSTA